MQQGRGSPLEYKPVQVKQGEVESGALVFFSYTRNWRAQTFGFNLNCFCH